MFESLTLNSIRIRSGPKSTRNTNPRNRRQPQVPAAAADPEPDGRAGGFDLDARRPLDHLGH